MYVYFQVLRFLCKPSFTMSCPSLKHGGTNDQTIGVQSLTVCRTPLFSRSNMNGIHLY